MISKFEIDFDSSKCIWSIGETVWQEKVIEVETVRELRYLGVKLSESAVCVKLLYMG